MRQVCITLTIETFRLLFGDYAKNEWLSLAILELVSETVAFNFLTFLTIHQTGKSSLLSHLNQKEQSVSRYNPADPNCAPWTVNLLICDTFVSLNVSTFDCKIFRNCFFLYSYHYFFFFSKKRWKKWTNKFMILLCCVFH